jgi:hypothetical protein
LGALRIVGKKPDGRIYFKYKGLAAGIGFDRGKSKVRLTKPRAWYDGRSDGPGAQHSSTPGG